MNQINGRLNAQGNITGSLNGAGGGGATALTQLTDVNISNPTNDQALVYDSESSKWVNASLPSGVDELSDLTDVDTGILLDGYILRYDSSTQKWYSVNPESVFPWHDHESTVLWVLNQGIVNAEFNFNITNMVIDLHFSVPNICPSDMTISYNSESGKWKLRITIPYDENQPSVNCLITLRNSRW